MRKNLLIVTVLLAFIVASVGCSASGGSEKALRKKVTQEWQAKMNMDVGALYDLTTDEHKKRVPRESFKYEPNVTLVGFSIEKLEIVEEGTKALVRVDIKVKPEGFEFTFPTHEEWLWQGGEWRLNVKPAQKMTIPTEK
ncbi:MAG: hypothetical protein E4G90_04270 [Gemmatimonadales bacterium]|nr:MAG: hypothetical protein E4G90_04270 [Gemmatimonadales bacterium]